MEEPISIRFKYTEEEYIAASRLYVLRSTGAALRLAIFSLFLLVGLFLLLLSLDFDFPLSCIATVLLLSFFWSQPLYLLPRQRFRSDPRFKDEYLLQFSDDGIWFKTSQIDAMIQWSLYTKAIENERFYLLIQGQNTMSVIPKRAFRSADEEAAFDELLKRKLPTRSKRLNARNSIEKPYMPPKEPPDWR